MQRIQNMTTTTSLLPEELLVAAYAHERREKQRYRMLALRFQPFDAVTHRLLQMFAEECEQRLDALARAAERLDLCGSPCSLATEEPLVKARHFFIVDERMAAQMLARTVVDEHRSLTFYRQLAEANALPQLYKLLAGFIHQKQAQIRILEESQSQTPALAYRQIA